MKRLVGLDLLKAVAMLMVVSLHSGIWHYNFIDSFSVAAILQYAGRLLSEGVPIFIMVNGYLLFAKRMFDLRSHVRKTLNILFLLVIWSLILAIAGSLINGTELSIGRVLELFIGTRNGSLYTGPMWFMQAMFALYLVYPLLRFAYDNKKSVFIFVFVVVFFFTAGLSVFKMGVTAQEAFFPDTSFG